VQKPDGLPYLQVLRKTGNEVFKRNGEDMPIRLLDFWRWSASDIIGNAQRGILAEYIVASALGIADAVQERWAAYDLQTRSGIKIEVKSCAYIQTWYQKSFSTIGFSIKPSISWDASTNQWGTDKRRQADVYVFCVLNHKDQDTIDPLNLDQWDFYILPSSALNTLSPSQKTLRLSELLKLKPSAAKYEDIAACIESFNDRCDTETQT
jgi:hypothetical protein